MLAHPDVRAVLPIFLLVALASGCRSRQLAAGEHSTRAIVLRVPFAARSMPGDGGIACVGQLLRYHGLDLDLEAEQRFPAEESLHVSPGELRDYLRGRGFEAEILRGELGDSLPRGLFAFIERGHPAILELTSGFVLAYGFDPDERTVYLDDPHAGRRELSYEELDEAWAPSGRSLLVAVPRAAR